MTIRIQVICDQCGEVVGDTSEDVAASFQCPTCGSYVSYNPALTKLNRASAYEISEPDPPEEVGPPPDGTRVVCPVCRRNLLGVWQDGALQIRHRGREWIIHGGSIGIKCHDACGGILVIDTTLYEVNIVASLQSVLDQDVVIDATDAAIALSLEAGIAVTDVPGSGKDGRVTKPDVVAHLGGIDKQP